MSRLILVYALSFFTGKQMQEGDSGRANLKKLLDWGKDSLLSKEGK